VSDEIRDILNQSKTVAVVGLSESPDRPSHYVAEYLQSRGYRIIPVNPAVKEVLGERSYGGLREIPVPVDLVDIFRKSDAVPPIVDDAIAIGAKAVWMQEGVVHDEAAAKARAAGLKVVMDRCTLKEHARLAAGGK
jgi:predicted CoA-binding protein